MAETEKFGFLVDFIRPHNASFMDLLSLRDGIGLCTIILAIGYVAEVAVLIINRECAETNSTPLDFDYRVLSTQEWNKELCGAGLLGNPRWLAALSLLVGTCFLFMGYYALFTKDREQLTTVWGVCVHLQVLLTMQLVYVIATFCVERSLGFFWGAYRFSGTYNELNVVLAVISYFVHFYMVYLCWAWFKLNKYELPNDVGDEEEEVDDDYADEIKPINYPSYVDVQGDGKHDAPVVPHTHVPGYDAVVESQPGNTITEALGVMPKASPEETLLMSQNQV